MKRRISQSRLNAKMAAGAKDMTQIVTVPQTIKEDDAAVKAVESVSADVRAAADAMLQSSAASTAQVTQLLAVMEKGLSEVMAAVTMPREATLIIERDYNGLLKQVNVVSTPTKLNS